MKPKTVESSGFTGRLVATMEVDDPPWSRTVVVSGVLDVLPVSRITDKLTVHFQSRRRSRGGDVEVVSYPTNVDGVAFVTFDDAADAERVVRKEQHIMADDEFPEDYVLTVFPFTRDVFFYVGSAVVDLSVFGIDQAPLIQCLRSAHRSLRFQPSLRQRKATVEGPFTAVQALREDLIRRAGRLKPTDQTASITRKETPLNPRIISHHAFVSSVSGGSSELQPANSTSILSAQLQTTGEATKVHTLPSNAKTPNASLRHKVSAVGSLCDTDGDEEEQRVQSRLQMRTECRTGRAKACAGVEINAGIRASLSGLDLLPAEEASAKQPREEDIPQKHNRPDRVTAKIRGENRLGSGDQSSSAVTAKLLQTRPKDVSRFPERVSNDTQEMSAARPEVTSIWVDSNAFRYIQKCDQEALGRCLRGLDVSVECVEGADLMHILLTEKQISNNPPRIQQALKSLSALLEFWLSLLRVKEVCFDQEHERESLVQVCEDVSLLFGDVLCVFEESCMKVIGPSMSGHLFCETVEEKTAKLKGKSLRM